MREPVENFYKSIRRVSEKFQSRKPIFDIDRFDYYYAKMQINLERRFPPGNVSDEDAERYERKSYQAMISAARLVKSWGLRRVA